MSLDSGKKGKIGNKVTLIPRFSGKRGEFNLFYTSLKIKLEGMSMEEEEMWELKARDTIPKPMFTYDGVLFKGVDLEKLYPDGEEHVNFKRATTDFNLKVNKLNGILLDVILIEYWNQKDSTYYSGTTPYTKWKEISQYYGDTNLATVAKLVGEFFVSINKDFNSLDTYLAKLKASANELNAKTENCLGEGRVMISEPLLAILPLLLLPLENIGGQLKFDSKFRVDKVQQMLKRIWGSQPKSMIIGQNGNRKVLACNSIGQSKTQNGVRGNTNHVGNGGRQNGKRKQPSDTTMKRGNQPFVYGECKYCLGQYNNLHENKKHLVKDCLKKKKDREAGFIRYCITEEPTKRVIHEIKEIHLDYTMGETVQSSGTVPVPVTVTENFSVSEIFSESADAEDEIAKWGDIDVMDTRFTHMEMDNSPEPFCDLGEVGNLASQSRKVIKDLDSLIKEKYPHFFYPRTLTKYDWALDGCCGSHLSGDIHAFHSRNLRKIHKYIFTFGEGTKLPNTHIGSVSLWFESINGLNKFTFKDVNFVPKAKSNILSE